MGNECTSCSACKNAEINVDSTKEGQEYGQKQEQNHQEVQKMKPTPVQAQPPAMQVNEQVHAAPQHQEMLQQNPDEFNSQNGQLNKYFSQDESKETMNQLMGNPNLIERRPPFTFKSGAIYDGEWKGTMREGYGLQICKRPDGARYEGEWKENKACGKGKFWHVDGDIFEGEWKEDKANGYGVYIHVNGAKYEGYWKDDLQDGQGVETWADGSRYEGQYKEGKKHGQGIYTWSDGSRYDGQWADNKISGVGTYTWLDGRKYEGEWLNNNMHGRGVYTWKDGRRYEGEYQFDKKHGFGVYTWADGRSKEKYEGQWAYGKQNGKGKYYLPDGTIKIGIWEDGKRIRWVEGDELANDKSIANTQMTSTYNMGQTTNMAGQSQYRQFH